MKRKLTLEHRIARLEKLFNSTVKKSRKFEGLHPDMLRELQIVFDNHFGSEDCYDSERDFKKNMFALTQGDNDPAVDSAIMYMSADFDYDEDLLDDFRDDIADALAEMADDLDLDYDDDLSDDDDWDNDYNWDDEMDECRGRGCESRKRRTESNRSFRRVRNEDAKRLPNGIMANHVSDVLSSWADTSWSRPKDAIRELDRQGILDAATNKWYPTVDDVVDAIEDCWNDQIGSVGKGAAQFFIGNIGGDVRCSLTIYPISGGDSKARNITLKFNWPKSEM